jgi:PKD domain-containing protein
VATKCFKPVLGRRMRLTRVDGCGRPVFGKHSVAVTDGFVSANLTAEIEEGEEITQKNASGALCASLKTPSQTKWITAELTFCMVDPGLVSLINPSFAMELDAKGNIVGWREKNKPSARGGGFALEIWTDTVGADVCGEATAAGAWGYILLPFLGQGTMGDLEIGASAINFVFTGNAIAGSQWGHGPHKVVADTSGAPSPLLAPIANDEIRLIMATTIAPPPVPADGCNADMELKAPSGLALTAEQDSTDNLTYTLHATGAGTGNALFDFGDGHTESVVIASGKADSAKHKYAKPGVYPVTVSASGETVADQATPGIAVPTHS